MLSWDVSLGLDFGDAQLFVSVVGCNLTPAFVGMVRTAAGQYLSGRGEEINSAVS